MNDDYRLVTLPKGAIKNVARGFGLWGLVIGFALGFIVCTLIH